MNRLLNIAVMVLALTAGRAEAFSLSSFFFGDEVDNKASDAKAAENKDAESEVPATAAISEGDNSPDAEEVSGIPSLTGSRNWRSPDFSKQETALGYSPEAFAIPKGMEEQVEFWKKIYSKYTTNQGVIHDIDKPATIYEEIDFAAINKDESLSPKQKAKARKKLVEDLKEKVIAEKSLPKDQVRFQLGQKDRFEQALFFSGRYLEDFEKTFKEDGMPIELTRLVFVESSFNVLARSKVGASGLWQIMSYTGRPYMMVNRAIDKRNHPLDATRLAAKLLRQNFQLLNSWPLAITAYNHGPSGVKRIAQFQETESIAEIVANTTAKKKLGFASRNFYACFLAALNLEKEANKYFPKAKWSNSLLAKEFKTEYPLYYKDLLKWFDGDDAKAQIYNPHLMTSVRKNFRAIPKGVYLAIPEEKYEVAMSEIKDWANKKSVNTKEPNPLVEAEAMSQVHKVESGDTLASIAKSYGVRMRKILDLNDLDSPNKLRVGQTLRIPTSEN